MATTAHRTKSPKNAGRSVSAGSQPVESVSVWVMNGRVVSHTLNEPAIKQALIEERAARTGSPQKIAELKAHYIRRGLLTAQGKLAKRYGG